ncbi:MEDS domain-containing protein [Actinoplanes sp. NPDC026670]|uniref:MEDS domain-containing protein n=1 Tax=Actinoplanes sp. NPDC026670 TaxID=3154700 RepID=UPI0033F43D9C
MTAATTTHACWSYDSPTALDAYAREFLRAGLTAGERIWYVPGSRSGAVADWLRSLAPVSSRPDPIRIIAWQDAYTAGQVIDPAEQIASYAAVTQAALADGFTGFRVVADVTALVRTPAQRDAFARYEYAIGRYMRIAPMRALCTYDRRELGERVVDELACLHETSHASDVTFQLHAGLTSAEAVLDGELDMAGQDLFADALWRTDLEPAGGEVTVDARGLRFIDHQSLLVLQRYAQARRLTAVVRTGLSSAVRLAGLLELSHVRVETAR